MKLIHKDMNLYSEFMKNNQNAASNEQNINIIFVVIFSLVLIIALSVSLRLKALNIERKIEFVNNKIDILCESDDFKNMSVFNQNLDMLEQACIDISLLNEYIDNYFSVIPRAFWENIKYSQNSVKISVYSYNSSLHSLSIYGQASSSEDISSFITKLRDCEICEKIDYSGYSVSENVYSFNAVCFLAQSKEVETVEQ